MPGGKTPTRILHVDGDSFFASCEIALHPEGQGRPVWVGGGRRGKGIAIAPHSLPKKFGVKTCMACFGARRFCLLGITGPPNCPEYRRMSHDMFEVLVQYSPTLVP